MGSIVLDMTGDEQRVLRSLVRAEKEVDNLQKQLAQARQEAKRVGDAGQTAGRQHEAAFGSGAQRHLQNYLTGLVSIGGAFGTIVAGLRDIRRMEEEAGQRITDAASGRRAFLQLTSDAAEYDALVRDAERVRTGYGLKAAEAYRITFAAQSADLRESLDLFASLSDISFGAESAISAVQKIQASFGGPAGAGTPRQIINKILAATKESPLAASEFARAAPIAATEAGALGLSDEQYVALLASLSGPFKTPQTAAERLKQVFAQVTAKQGFIALPGDIKAQMTPMQQLEDLSLFEQLGVLRGREEKPIVGRVLEEESKGLAAVFRQRGLLPSGFGKSMEEFLGSQEAVAAARQIKIQKDVTAKRLEDIQEAQRTTGTAADLLTKRLQIGEEDPALAAEKAARVARERGELQTEKLYGSAEKLAETFVNRTIERMRTEGAGEFGLWVEQKKLEAERFIKGPQRFLREHLFELPEELLGPAATIAGLGFAATLKRAHQLAREQDLDMQEAIYRARREAAGIPVPGPIATGSATATQQPAATDGSASIIEDLRAGVREFFSAGKSFGEIINLHAGGGPTLRPPNEDR